MTPNQAWEVFVGADSTDAYTADDLAAYVQSSPVCEDLDDDARTTLRQRLVQNLAR